MKVLIWGTGYMASDYLQKGEVREDDIIGFVESKKSKNVFMGKKVYEPSEIAEMDGYDYILVCVKYVSREIYELCKVKNVDTDKLILMDNWEWMDGTCTTANLPVCCRKINDNGVDVEKLFPKFWNNYERLQDGLSKYYIVALRNGYDRCDHNALMLSEEFCSIGYQLDYFRFRTFELVANEIIKNKVKGSVAELGVFMGSFSQMINAKFPDKKIYLFDTFESFDEHEFKEEVKRGRVSEDFREGFKNTSVERVLARMPYPNKCVIKKGLFPDTAVGLENEEYAFVSIDVDLEKSIFEGLRYFYPRLKHRGAIFLHDYNNYCLEGVKEAVKLYEEETGTYLPKVPLSDEGGTLVIVK